MYYPKVSVIIPVHNGIEYTVKCLDSLKEVVYPNFEIIIVDDGSTDCSGEIITENYHEIKIIKGSGNLWWSGAMNLGIKYALKQESEYILALNNDNIVDKFFLKELVICAQENPKSIIGSKVYYIDSPFKIRYAGGYFDWKRGKTVDLHYGEIDHGQFAEIKEVEFLGGMGVLIPVNTFKDVGFFDDINFPQYSGDIDYWLRAKKKGYKILFNPNSIIWDHTDKSGTKNLGVKLSPIYIWKSFFSIKSHINIKTQYVFFKRHCTQKYFIKSLILFYFDCIKYWVSIK
jgi:GT2 family glycosyltransferase